MRTVRSNCFETNSSSTHSITVSTETPATFKDVKGVVITTGEFGWEHLRYNDFETKCRYFWTLVCNAPKGATELQTLKTNLLRLAAKHGFLLIEQDADDYSYVDHGIEHYADFVHTYPNLVSTDALEHFLFNEECWLFLGNDNGSEPPCWRVSKTKFDSAPLYMVVEDSPWITPLFDTTEENIDNAAAEAVYNVRRDGNSRSGYSQFKERCATYIHIDYVEYNYKAGKNDIVDCRAVEYQLISNEEYLTKYRSKYNYNEAITQVQEW